MVTVAVVDVASSLEGSQEFPNKIPPAAPVARGVGTAPVVEDAALPRNEDPEGAANKLPPPNTPPAGAANKLPDSVDGGRPSNTPPADDKLAGAPAAKEKASPGKTDGL